MAMNNPVQPVLQPVRLEDLRPTQLTVGMLEVERKRVQWRERPLDKEGVWLGRHMIPAVTGPKGEHWIIDHHHLALALLLEGVEQVLASVVVHLDHLSKKQFLAFMGASNSLHLYGSSGRRCGVKALPRRLVDLDDDPYRSLAGEVRRAGGYAKSSVPYTEFLWADFFRNRVGRKSVEDKFSIAVSRALDLARSPAARHLPGWAGAVEPQI